MKPDEQSAAFRDVVAWTEGDACEQLRPLRLRAEPSDETCARRVTGEGARAMMAQRRSWISEEQGLCVRYARVQSLVADVATVMIYPVWDVARLPVLAAEWVVIGDRCHVAVLDVEAVAGGSLLQELRQAFGPESKNEWPARFDCSPEVPAWFAAIASDWAVFTSVPSERLGELRAAFGWYLETCTRAFYLPRVSARADKPEHSTVLAYKRHHQTHFPGRQMLVARFGTVWAERFLECHFGPARLG